MTTPAQTRRLAAFALVGGGSVCAAVVAPGVAAFAQPPSRPAAWFSPPEAFDASPDTARGAPGESFKQAEPSTLPANWLDSTPVTKPGPRVSPSPRQHRPEPPSDWQQFKTWVGGKTDAVKKTLTPDPSPQPVPRVNQPAPASNSTVPPGWGTAPLPKTGAATPPANSTVPQSWGAAPQPQSQPKPAQPTANANSTIPPAWGGAAPQPQLPDGPTTYAGNPAYRWYGWGTVTPGANPYAPGGTYPQASGTWYAQSGATPGAFPVPTVNAFRPPPGPEPPVYAGMPQKVALPRVSQPPVSFSQPARGYVPPPTLPRPIAQTPAPTFLPPTGPTPPPVPQAWRPPSGILSEKKPEPAVVEPKWQPASASVPVTRGQMPDDSAAVDARIRAACDGLVSEVVITRDGPNVVLSYAATTETLADIAARAVSAIPELQPVAVTFNARLRSR